ncbi:hypothetical protein SAMN02910315_00377 [Methanobrevibacter millerae]|uniref:Uncharacterized protein n=1 Tax=Methanobrevibacter millerae TaxID=230361 RepID=A0A1G5V7C0_9EURY|nr:hypothetical protein SAMN02910315_00377 [Methanobrevibacter millerae]
MSIIAIKCDLMDKHQVKSKIKILDEYLIKINNVNLKNKKINDVD